MKSIHYLLLSLTISMPGCVMLASDSSLDKGKASSLTHLYIAPIEGIPLAPSSFLVTFIQQQVPRLQTAGYGFFVE